MNKIVIKNAYTNNLKHLDLNIPLDFFTCVTGCSGCGKSSLVFDTIYAESQRALLEGMGGNIFGQKLMDKPKVDSIENLRPALNISQNDYNVNPRSTIGTLTEISNYMRSLFAIVNSNSDRNISESMFSSNNPKACCPHCAGLGIEHIVSETLLIPDPKKSLREGAILFFKGPPAGKEQRYLEALCEHYEIDIDKTIVELTENELHLLMYANDNIKYKLSYKEGRRRRQYFVFLNGAISTIEERVASLDSTGSSAVYGKYMKEVPCRVCNGAGLHQETLQYKVCGLSYDAIEHMELTTLYQWLHELSSCNNITEKDTLVSQLANGILPRLEMLIQLNIGYLCLRRSIPTLSGGERQRVRLATQLSCSLKGLLYILDEPCRGLHYRDITNIIQATLDLVRRGNTVIAIEHNKDYIAAAHHTIELGPVGGPNGGYLVERHVVSSPVAEPSVKPILKSTKYLEICGINYRNIKNQDIRFPVGGITCITGVSGSGKSTLTAVISKCFANQAGDYCKSFHGGNDIKRIIQVNQSPIGKTPRSTVASYLEIFDEIRTLFSETEHAKSMKINASQFSMNIKGGRCENCQGTGLKKIELNFLPNAYITCPECQGKRFNETILSITYQGKTILDILETPITDIIKIFQRKRKIFSILSSMVELGLGYLKLGQMSMNLSGGEAQRVKLAKALGGSFSGRNLYIMDEPTTGLNSIDIEKLKQLLLLLQSNHETMVLIEHNVEFIESIGDYIIDLGVMGGDAGGKIVAQGLPEVVFSDEKSSVYQLNQASRWKHL